MGLTPTKPRIIAREDLCQYTTTLPRRALDLADSRNIACSGSPGTPAPPIIVEFKDATSTVSRTRRDQETARYPTAGI